MFSKGELSVLHNTRRKFVKELLRNIGPNEAVEHIAAESRRVTALQKNLKREIFNQQLTMPLPI